MMSQNSSDPFLTLLRLSHAEFETIYLVNNTEEINHEGNEYIPLGFRFQMTPDDGESSRQVQIEIDNVSLELINSIRTVTTPIDANVRLVLASQPNEIQVEIGELKIKNVTYDRQSIRGILTLDDFLNTEMTSEKYGPENFPGLF